MIQWNFTTVLDDLYFADGIVLLSSTEPPKTTKLEGNAVKTKNECKEMSDSERGYYEIMVS